MSRPAPIFSTFKTNQQQRKDIDEIISFFKEKISRSNQFYNLVEKVYCSYDQSIEESKKFINLLIDSHDIIKSIF